eukprot:scaffold129902_cov15-Prasinocladus_malaysianus.AAC.1
MKSFSSYRSIIYSVGGRQQRHKFSYLHVVLGSGDDEFLFFSPGNATRGESCPAANGPACPDGKHMDSARGWPMDVPGAKICPAAR